VCDQNAKALTLRAATAISQQPGYCRNILRIASAATPRATIFSRHEELIHVVLHAATTVGIQLQQVILNLIVNAIDAMSDVPSFSRKIVVQTAHMPDCAEVIVSDTGPGIPPEKLRQVFEPFFTTKEGGMGIGLSIVRTIVEAHKGRIVAENAAGGGAVFRVTLPLAKMEQMLDER
jgi:signal transduction histidine kinase